MSADPDRLRRLLENLIRNAIDHGTDDGTGVDLEIRIGTIPESAPTDDPLEGFYVEDDGIGIPACRRDQVLENGYTTDDSGTGLGLSIVERIADAHGWTVRVSEIEAGGARFELTGIDPATVSDPAARTTERERNVGSSSR